MEPACEAQGVRVNYHAETEMPLLKANPTRLQQAVMAVLFNSLQAMRDTGGSITLSTIAILDRFGRTNGVQLSIEDTGKGILAEDIEAIYQPLYTTHPRPDSVGMGLTFAERFVLEVQGRLELYSTPGIGTCATLLLPCLYIADIPTDANNPSDALQKTRAFLRKVA
jgi:signal transduction histidine kinase